MSEQPQHQSNPFGRKRDEIATLEELLSGINRPIPHDKEAEQLVIGFGIQYPEWLQRNFAAFSPSLFYHEANRIMAMGCVDLLCEGKPLDPIILTGHLRANGTLERVGGPAMIMETYSQISAQSLVEWHLKNLLTLRHQRQLAHALSRGLDAIFCLRPGEEGALESVIDLTKGLIEEAGHIPGKRLRRLSMEQAVGMVIDEIDERVKNPDKLPGWPTGFATLDKHMRCLQKGRVTVFAGMPSDGKSAIMQNCAMGALRAGAKVGWYSLEMPISEQTLRIIAEECGIPNDSLYDGQMNRGQFDALQSAVRRMKTMGAELIDTDGATAQDLITDIEKGGYDIAVIDYLQLMEDSSSRKSDTRENIISGISRRLKRLAVRTGTHILTASQLNDNGKLRESRAIGQDADAVMIIQKMPANDPRGLPDGQHDEDAEGYDDTRRLLLGEKNRGGKRGFVIPCHFQGATFTFKEIL